MVVACCSRCGGCDLCSHWQYLVFGEVVVVPEIGSKFDARDESSDAEVVVHSLGQLLLRQRVQRHQLLAYRLLWRW